MPTYKYRPYYQFNGPTASNPFREEKTPEEVEQSLEFFYSELTNHFGDIPHQVHKFDGIVSVTADIPEEKCDSLVANCLNDNDLYADKIKRVICKI